MTAKVVQPIELLNQVYKNLVNLSYLYSQVHPDEVPNKYDREISRLLTVYPELEQ